VAIGVENYADMRFKDTGSQYCETGEFTVNICDDAWSTDGADAIKRSRSRRVEQGRIAHSAGSGRAEPAHHRSPGALEVAAT